MAEDRPTPSRMSFLVNYLLLDQLKKWVAAAATKTELAFSVCFKY